MFRRTVDFLMQHRIYVGTALALCASASYGGSQVFEKWIVTNITTPIVTSAFSLLFGGIFISAVFHRGAVGDVRITPKKAWLFVMLAGLSSTVASVFLLFALRSSPVVLVSPMISINALVTLVLSHFFLQRLERVTWRLILGTLLIIGGAATITLSAAS